MTRNPMCCIVPDYVLRRIAERGSDEERRAALDAMATCRPS
jgi:Protealysin propeptide